MTRLLANSAGKTMNELVNRLIAKTIEGTLEWTSTSNPFEYCTTFEGIRYSLEYDSTGEKELYTLREWDNKGNIKETAFYQNAPFLQQQLRLLYSYMLRSNQEINHRYNTYIGKMQEVKKEAKEKNYSVSLYKVMERLGLESGKERPIVRIEQTESFYYMTDDLDGFISRYVQPPMSQMPTSSGMTSYQEAEVILISAPGATGKTAMSNYLSNQLQIPILDLGHHDAVGANSIAGLLMQQVNQEDVFIYHGGLKNGGCSMIIDGLDEASIHISWESFEAFLKNVAFFAKGAVGLPFVVLGRPGVMEDAALVLEENGVKVSLLQIEPFTVKKAVDFIDNQMPRNYISSHYKEYKAVRDYIIEQIGGFFKSESDLNKKLFEHFIGYAPVLQSISNLLNEEKDFHRLLYELKSSKKQKVDLLIDIVQRIMKREQGKIVDEVVPQLFEPGRQDSFKFEINRLAGNEEEQCRRVLARFLGKDVTINISGDHSFDERYNDKTNKWIKNHPFFLGNEAKIQNIVFESYLIAMLIDKEECRDDVLEYLTMTGSCSYLLLDIYSAMKNGQDGLIDYRFFPFLYDSFKALDHPQDFGTTEIESDYDESDETKCFLSFGRDESETEYDFTFMIDHNEWLPLSANLSAINIDAPINVEIATKKVDLQAPISISCHALRITSKEVLLSTASPISGSIVLESNSFSAFCHDGNVPALIQRTPAQNNNLLVITSSETSFPFREYTREPVHQQGIEKQLAEAFQKMRRMILMFRSHSKGVLARYCGKIDSRIGKSELGVSIIEELKRRRVLYTDNIMYFINIEKFGEVLGAKYDDIRSSIINEKMMSFLKSIVAETK